MAKAIITLEDGDDGVVHCRVDFEPAVKPNETGTPAQAHALEMVSASMRQGKNVRARRKR